MRRMSGKVAIVTGAGSDLGTAEAYLLAQEGAKVIATDTDYGRVRKVVGEINRRNPGTGLALTHDVSQRDDWIKIINAGVDTFGAITVLVNNTGIPTYESCDQASQGKFIKSKNIDAWSQFVGIETIVPVMKHAGVGSIVNVAPFEVLEACGHFNISAASIHSAEAFIRTTSAELAPFNIRINAVATGPFRTWEFDNTVPVDGPPEDAPIGRSENLFAQVSDVVQLVLYLASDDASSTTGMLHVINGGGDTASDNVQPVTK